MGFYSFASRCSRAVPVGGKWRRFRWSYGRKYLTEPTPAPVLAGDTNLDLVGHVFDWQAALGACNADKAAIRAAAGKE